MYIISVHCVCGWLILMPPIHQQIGPINSWHQIVAANIEQLLLITVINQIYHRFRRTVILI